MISQRYRTRTTRVVVLVCATLGIGHLLPSGAILAAERQFLVSLAASPKEFNPPCDPDLDDPCPDRGYTFECRLGVNKCVTPCDSDDDCEDVTANEGPTFICNLHESQCVVDLATPEDIRKQYFDDLDDNIGSFAEFMEEISYGDITISARSRVTDWVNLPWAFSHDPVERDGIIVPEVIVDPEIDVIGLPEPFRNDLAMLPVDLDGDPNGVNNGPFTPEDNPTYARGGRDFIAGTAIPIWMPGERFVDVDGDGRWDGLDEATNQMDFFDNATGQFVIGGDGRPDRLGPWVDLDGDGVAANAGGCLYLPDGDNDGNPDCCPAGPGRLSCPKFDGSSINVACPPTTWNGPNGPIVDCNGNMIPDSCDIACDATCIATGYLDAHPEFNCNPQSPNRSQDRLPVSEGAALCDLPAGDGIPDECQFVDPATPCVEDPVDDIDSPCFDLPVCIPVIFDRTPIPRCEFDDSNNDGTLDIVEPFENFIRRWVGSDSTVASAAYIRSNYAGDADKVIARGEIRAVRGLHDPLGKLDGEPCECANGQRCLTNNTPTTTDDTCLAGIHAQYDPPDWWSDFGDEPDQQFSSKMAHAGSAAFTPEPDWYEQAWRDRFDTPPPPWTSIGVLTPRMVPVIVREIEEADRRFLLADRGGLEQRPRPGQRPPTQAVGWFGCSENDPGIVFQTGDAEGLFQQECDGALILPEETRGLNDRLSLYDGPREFVDLPSSKYHRTGDGRLGEVTSPFNNSIWGQDLGTNNPDSPGVPDGIIPAAGPYATRIHGNLGYDAGNLLHMELLTWKDANLDGYVDQGFVQIAGSDNYRSAGRQRLMEDVVEVIDESIDFDDFVDSTSLERIECREGPLTDLVSFASFPDLPPEERMVDPAGICSGIVLLPERVYNLAIRPERRTSGCTLHSTEITLFPIHNEDGLNDPQYQDTDFPADQPQLSLNIFFHDFVRGIDVETCGLIAPWDNFQNAYAAQQWLHTWEGFPHLYDYDVFIDGGIQNCPVGLWDVMAEGGLVHPAPVLKEKPCTEWIESVDLKTILTPGVDSTITLPPAEFVQDESYYYLENATRPGERYYFWSAGSGFDASLPGSGMLIMHSDLTPPCETDADCPIDPNSGTNFPCVSRFCDGAVSNLEAPPPQQRTATRPTYLIVQADGAGELEACADPDPPDGPGAGDDGDVWPGSTGATQFNFNTNPPATWYSQNSWTGLDISEVVPDGNGSVQIRINWVPTSIPSLRFQQPPGGASVGSIYQILVDATDLFGGTTLQFYYMNDEKACSHDQSLCTSNADCAPDGHCRYDTTIGRAGVTPIGDRIRKITPGTSQIGVDWDIRPGGVPIADGRYVLFAKLNPGPGADGTEERHTDPRAGRNNVGDGSLSIIDVSIDNDIADDDDFARLETWTVVCRNGDCSEWRVNSTLTQPVLNEDDPDSDPYPPAQPGVQYTSLNGEVTFQIDPGSEPFAMGDSFTFTTTGITAVSRTVTIAAGRISENPTAIIRIDDADGVIDPGGIVEFDGQDSVDPNGEALQFTWDFGDGTQPGAGAVVSHVFARPGTFTVTLTVRNPVNQRIGQESIDILVNNTSPLAFVSATTTSGPVVPNGLTVTFFGSGSSDAETDSADLIYFWDFGDGDTANNDLIRGESFESVTHTYRTDENGVACTAASPCELTAALTVIDECDACDTCVPCEKEDTDTITILVGNTVPEPVITATPKLGPEPLVVEFNASASSDADGDALSVTFDYGDGSPTETIDLNGASGGIVQHTYRRQGNQGIFHPSATLSDGRTGGNAIWSGETITVLANQPPTASFNVIPESGTAGVPINFDASASSDPEGAIASYIWDFGDGTAPQNGELVSHTYEQANLDGYTVKLTVTDNRDASDVATKTVVVVPGIGNQAPVAHIATGPRSGTAPLMLQFDGSNSFDPDGDSLEHRWSFTFNTQPEDTRIGSVVTKEFRNPGTYTVVLTVDDNRGGIAVDGPETILVTAAADNGPTDEPDDPGQQPDGDEPPDSADQRPTPRFCGLGMVMSMFWSLLGLVAMALGRRRYRL